MGKYADTRWYPRRLKEYEQTYGAVPPPWIYLEDTHPYSICWRMGAGETFMMVFGEWWEQMAYSEAQRLEYFRKWPPPPRWIPWMLDALWDLRPWVEEAFDYAPYYKRIEAHGFLGVEDIEADLNDPKWLER